MRPGVRRWPVHPPPHPGEGLTSWLGRLASVYRQTELVRMHASGDCTIAELMEEFSVGRATVYRVLNRAAANAAPERA